MPDAPPDIFTPPSAGSPPVAPGAIFAQPGGGGAPIAPEVVFTAPSAGSPPDSPDAVYTAPGGGSPPAVPGPVFTPPTGGSPPAAPPQVFPPPVVDSGAFLETLFAGSNNDLRFEQIGSGSSPTIQLVMDNSGSNTVTVTGVAILIHLRQLLGAFYLTAADIKQLVEDSAPASALVRVLYKSGNDGSGAVAQPATANLSFGPTPLSAVPVATIYNSDGEPLRNSDDTILTNTDDI